MKKMLLIITVLLYCSCQNDEGKEKILVDVQQQKNETISLSSLEEAKATLDDIFLQGKLLKAGEISKEKHDALTYPLGQKFRKLKASLNEEEKEKLKEYGLKRFEEVYPKADRKEKKNN